MLGDWVRHGFGHEGKVTAIDSDVVTVYDKGFDDGDGHCEVTFAWNEIKPIPLTAEILDKNEFKCEEIIQRHWISEGGRILLKNDESLISSNNKWSVHVDNEDMQSIGYFEITYIHELQHVLRLCNIDKEIKV